MQISIEQSLLAEVEAFLAETNIAPSRFGLDAMGDGALVKQLRQGERSLTLKNADKVLSYIRHYRASAEAE
jgi:hypothetical protein